MISIDLELLSPFCTFTQVAKVPCMALFSVRFIMWSESKTGARTSCTYSTEQLESSLRSVDL